MSVRTVLLLLAIAFVQACLITEAAAKDFEDYAQVVLVNHPQSGVVLSKYKAWFRDRAKQTFLDLWAYGKEEAPIREAGYNYEVGYTNASSQDIVALQVNVVAFNAFWEYCDTFAVFHGAIISPGKSLDKGGMVSFNNDVSALYYAAWVDKVLFDDGTVWKMDLATVRQQIEEKFNVSVDYDWLSPASVIEVHRDEKFRRQVQPTGREPVH
jgi:hypothetical protein